MFGRRRRERHARADISLIDQWVTAAYAARAGTGTPVPYDQLPITQGLASLIADALAAMPLYPVDQYTGERLDVRFAILEQPNPDEHRADTVHKIAQALFWTGNAVALNGPIGADMAVESINVLNPNSVSERIDPVDELHIVGWDVNGAQYDRYEITHWKLNDDPRRGPMGSSPLQRCRSALDTYGWAYRYLADFFAGGGNPSTVFKSKLELSREKVTELANEWTASRQQTRPAFLPSWLDLEVPANNGEIRDIIDVLGFAAAEVARATNTPVSLVNAPVQGYSLQYANVGEELRRWLTLSLGTTYIARIERGFSLLLPPGIAASMEPEALYRADLFPETSSPPAANAAPAAAGELTEAAP